MSAGGKHENSQRCQNKKNNQSFVLHNRHLKYIQYSISPKYSKFLYRIL